LQPPEVAPLHSLRRGRAGERAFGAEADFSWGKR
jgi:hypothetical protein